MDIGHELVGSGPRRVLVLHGWFGDHRVWEPVYSLLNGAAFSYAFMDFRGYGASRDIAGNYTMQEMAADGLALADHLGWQRFSVVGHSMGGKVAQRLAIDAAARVLAVVGVTPVPVSGVPMPPDVRAVFEAVPTSDAAARGVISVSLGERPQTLGLIEGILQHQRRTADPSAVAAYFHTFTQSDLSPATVQLTQPLLVLAGEHDGGLSPTFVRHAFHAIFSQAEIALLHGAGHYPMLETSLNLVVAMERFLLTHGDS
ncbi:alpha/beta hydrolase [Paraburkholderia sediminicola]|uniref:alpha/beta fold hydrolase n=1 Tax=Paraburkholderia sediminicola TaxID=458836 RepID=UPI0038B6E644